MRIKSKVNVVRTRLTNEQYQKLKLVCEAREITTADAIREALFMWHTEATAKEVESNV